MKIRGMQKNFKATLYCWRQSVDLERCTATAAHLISACHAVWLWLLCLEFSNVHTSCQLQTKQNKTYKIQSFVSLMKRSTASRLLDSTNQSDSARKIHALFLEISYVFVTTNGATTTDDRLQPESPTLLWPFDHVKCHWTGRWWCI